ncbi:AMP-binding enzyme family protein (macronuclear) [Tetrahymena thermophila SB210]|uniref:AMP-binding enzyme family protein n=1 Tax=Tetrahymena thermophila (strain SB210) TaxID=312017 RepID=W7XB70_TETTS|nr:AMP-binding enzyme family protein [Tetrahymena thermophila SB210]EWS73663.1 AMP-binding enzyme family protein [Tetrahymena thermophila SB210]|eukprot:XP_012653793.1 AMP-binding enzyme family protein [Tetrahymena thermophila SB210]
MNFSRIDLFSSSFNFNIGGSNIQRGTIAGALFTIIVIALTLSYFIYLIELYFSNKIEPLYRAQNIINNQTQQLDINSNSYAIKINYLFPTVKQQKYTYSAILGTYKNDTDAHQVSITTKNCEDPNLGEQFECLDQIQFLDDNLKKDIQNFDYNYKLAQISIYILSCQDQDESQEQNCASQQEIDKVKTTIKDGLFIQQESSFTMPFNYNIDNQNLNRQFINEKLGFGPYSIVNFQIDQIYSQISIQYPTIPSVLALVNSVFNLLVILGFFLKITSQSSLKEDFFVILIKNVYQDIYQQILQLNDLKKSNSTIGQQTKSFISNEIFDQKGDSELKTTQENTKLKIENIGPKLSQSDQLKQKDGNQSLIFSKDCFEERNNGQQEQGFKILRFRQIAQAKN